MSRQTADAEGAPVDPLSYGEHERFPGVIGRTVSTSIPAWPTPTRPRSGSPNVVLVLLDDVGFGQLGCFGAPIETPTFDRLAGNGLRYRSFHTTSLCTPSRASLLTGRNHHAAGAGYLAHVERGYPSYDTRIPKSNGFLSEILRANGYATFALGKWHLAPSAECLPGSTRARWPLARGFDRYYGFLDGLCDHFAPGELVHDNHFVEPPFGEGHEYHLNDDLSLRAQEFITDLRAVAPDQPFFLYWCPGAGHSPHHVPAQWSTHYAGGFDDGWEHLRERTFRRQVAEGIAPASTPLEPRPEWIAPWTDHSRDERRLFARQMEVYAGFLSHTDDSVGRLVAFLDRIGELDNTIFIVTSDNGPSSEGGPTGMLHIGQATMDPAEALAESIAGIDAWGGPSSFPHYAWGWTWAGSAPLRRWKRYLHEGGVRVPFVIHWPSHIAGDGEIRDHYVHIVDVVPTILDALGIEAPDAIDGVGQLPMHGASFAPTFVDADARTDKHVQYYEMLGSRAIWQDGWKAVTEQQQNVLLTDALLDAQQWELYHLPDDVSELNDLADVNPEKVRQLVDLWWVEAGRNAVLPLDARRFATPPASTDEPTRAADAPRTRFVYYPGGAQVSAIHGPDVWGRRHRISAAVTLSADSEGMLFVAGGDQLGFALYVRHQRLHYVYTHLGHERGRIVSETDLPVGPVVLSFNRESSDSEAAIGTLFVNHDEVGQSEIHDVTGSRALLRRGLLTCGYAARTIRPLSADYVPPFRFIGRLDQVVVEVAS